MGDPIAPGATIGVLGAGQLGRMLAIAAAELGYRCHVFAPEPDPPAGHVADALTTASYEDADALDRFAAVVDVVTLEFENVPVAAVERLERRVPVRPGARVLSICQDRLAEKDFLDGIGVPVAPYRPAASAADLDAARRDLAGPCIAKTARFGYDGKGQAALDPDGDPDAVWRRLATGRAIVEARVDFARELAVIAARGADGRTVCYPAVETRHEHHILDETIVPAPIDPAAAAEAERIARTIAEALDLVGLVAVEMFHARDGRILVNELAPRPHNSGHWTIDAAATSQFSQAVRAVCGLPLGDPAALCPAVMKNLIGDEVAAWADYLAQPGACLHLYGKAEVRPGRKMGHVTFLKR